MLAAITGANKSIELKLRINVQPILFAFYLDKTIYFLVIFKTGLLLLSFPDFCATAIKA
jgi:hypothetical protein